MLSLTSNQNQMLNPAQTDTMPCEYLSLDSFERWIIYGFTLCHQFLAQPAAISLWTSALQSGWVLPLFRDEVIFIHSHIQSYFDNIKGYGKRVNEVKECFNHAVTYAPKIHTDRRMFLRTALRELELILTDQPGLLGPKALFVFMGLSFARDEVSWLLRHHDNPPPRTNKSKSSEELVDRLLPELLFYMEEIRALVRKYSQVLQRYYVQYLSGYYALSLNQVLQPLQTLSEDDSIILSSLCNTIGSLSIKQVEDNELFDFRGMRLDWCRLQAYTSVGKSQLVLSDHRDLATLLNTITFHMKMVDALDDMLTDTSDLSLFCFYNKLFEDHFHMCLEFPAQNRYIIVFPLICGHFQNCTHELCPEERHHIRERSLSVVNAYLEEMAKEAKNIITTICDGQCNLSDKLLPKHCASMITQVVNKKKRDKLKKHPETNKPGTESYRKTREDLTTMDKLHMALTELCFAINYCPTITVWDYAFAPREYLYQHLESRFARAVVGMVMNNPETGDIAKPSELLTSVKAYMNVLQTVENYVHIDVTRVFNSVLLQQTQMVDGNGDKTIAALYVTWYTDVLMRRVSAGHICYSPLQQAFVSLTAEGAVPFNAEEFSDVTELRALAELIGPYGMKLLNETLMWHAASQVHELKKLVLMNKDVLVALRTNFDRPEQMKELTKRLQQVDNLLQRMTIVGVILSFRQLSQEALFDVLNQRVPFLLSSVVDFKEHFPIDEADPSVASQVNELASAAGMHDVIDPTLITALKAQRSELSNEDEHLAACLLLVFIAVSLPRLARSESSMYRAYLGGHANNAHCLAAAVNTILCALFGIAGRRDTEERLKEFLALASSSLLRLGEEQMDKDAIRNRESIYLLLDLIVKNSPHLTMDLLESCFPYACLRKAYQAVFRSDNVTS